MKKQTQPKNTTIYTCPGKLVTIVKKESNVRRWPKHTYPCFVYLLKAKEGTRIAKLPDGVVEFMPAFEDLTRMLLAIEPSLASVIPKGIRNKPQARKDKFDSINRNRLANRRRTL